LETGASGRD